MKQFTALDAALDAVSWEWLEQTHPALADALILEVGRGAQPGDVKRHVLARTFRHELALRCEQAARFLASEDEVHPVRKDPTRFFSVGAEKGEL